MEDSAEDVCVDPLFVGLTRPATVLGVPYAAFVAEVMGIALIFLAIGNVLYLLLFVPTHAILYAVSASDPGAFGSLFLWLQTSGRCLNKRFWGASSFSPLPTKKWKK